MANVKGKSQGPERVRRLSQLWIKIGRRVCSLNDYDAAQLNQEIFSFAMPQYEEKKDFRGNPTVKKNEPFQALQVVKS